MEKFFAGYRAFREDYFKKNREMIAELMTKRQSPQAMLIACSDSRIDPSLKFGVDPGDMFIVRNVAALVPPYEPDGAYHGTSAALEFAVQVLEVKNLIVMAHAKCGGIDALLKNQGKDATDFVISWMKIAEPARERTHAIADPDMRLVACEQESVKVSLENLMTFPWVRDRVKRGVLKLHGWYFDLETSTLYIMGADGTFAEAT